MATPYQLRLALRSALQRETVTISGLSHGAGLDRTTLSRFLNGKADLKISTLQKILELFGIDLALLIGQKLERTSEAQDPTLLRAFKALTPLQKKSFLKSIAQTLRYSAKSKPSRETEVLAEDLDRLGKELRLQGEK